MRRASGQPLLRWLSPTIGPQVLHLEKLETVEVWREANCVYLHQVNRPSVGAWVPQGAAKHVSGTLEFHDLVQVRPELKAPPFVLHTTTQVHNACHDLCKHGMPFELRRWV